MLPVGKLKQKNMPEMFVFINLTLHSFWPVNKTDFNQIKKFKMHSIEQE